MTFKFKQILLYYHKSLITKCEVENRSGRDEQGGIQYLNNESRSTVSFIGCQVVGEINGSRNSYILDQSYQLVTCLPSKKPESHDVTRR